ncbi:WD40 repeat-like protein [Thozetella sp. PMI_491]|nr:WD40 repeat-like protein [Thozetella sp. PMI_491]
MESQAQAPPTTEHTTEQYASRTPAAADALPTQANTGSIHEGTYQQVTVSEASTAALSMELQAQEPTTKLTTQQRPGISTSQSLWNAAYDSLEEDKDTKELVLSYLKTLTEVVAAGDINASTEDLKDPSKRQIFMEKVVKEGTAKVARASKITKVIGDFAEAILKAKPMVDLAIGGIPQAAPAALPWAGVCIGLQILSNPSKARKSNLAGITHVVSRMEWYCALTEHLLNQNNIKVGGKSFEETLELLKDGVISLYKALLLYQMKSACSYYQDQGKVFFQDLLYHGGWDDDLNNIKNAEDALHKDEDQYIKEYAKGALGEITHHTKEMEKLLQDLHQDIRYLISAQISLNKGDKESACLRDLRVVDPQDDMKRIEKEKDGLLDDAYKWILDTPQYAAFTNWDDTPNISQCQLLWINGHAGTGKTMLMIGIIRKLLRQPVLTPKLSFFFCQGTNTDLRNATSVLRSLIWLLLLQQPDLMSHLLQKHDKSGRKLFTDDNAFFALSEAFRNMLRDPSLSPVYFAVDALDECEQGLPDLIQLISESLSISNKVRWLVSSRPNVQLKRAGITETLLELEAQSLKQPVQIYINHKLSALKEKDGYNDDTLAEVSSAICERADNTFLWVALVFKELDSAAGWHAVRIINEIPSGLSELYDRIITRVEEDSGLDMEYCKNVLVATCLANQPLFLSELAVVAGLLPTIPPQKIVEKCGSFLTINEGRVYPIHQSAKEYLMANYESKLQPAGVARGHVDIGKHCINAMSLALTRNMYFLDYGFQEDVRPPERDLLAPLRYSCLFWVDHLCFPDGECLERDHELVDDGRVHRFLENHFLHWLESITLLGDLSSGLQSIRKLLQIIQAPLQIYGSALVFSPRMNAVKKAQWSERLPHIHKVEGIRDFWEAHRTLEGHSKDVNAIAFSFDGKMLASASNDTTVRLWDTAIGTSRELRGHNSYVYAIALSHDGKMLASASCDKIVRLWDTATGASRELQGHSGCVIAIAFSPDGKMLASASDDTTVRLWNTTTGTSQELQGHSDYVNAIAFSYDGKILASASHDTTVRLWDTATGTSSQKLQGHSNQVSAITFSPNGKILASASHDTTVRLWDTATGTTSRELRGHSNQVSAIAFSRDGKMLASASNDTTVRLWDTATGITSQELQGDGGWASAIAFSRDGKMLALASFDTTVWLWDTATATSQKLRGHSSYINAIAFSRDGKILASASRDTTVRLWDTAAGSISRELQGHSDCVHAITLSHDGKMLASASTHTTVRLWDTAIGTSRELRGHSGYVNAIAFSYDGKILASASDDTTVRLWDTATGISSQKLQGHSHQVSAITFSPNGKMLALASYDITVRLWNTATGTSRELQRHSGRVIALAFSPDGKMLASGSTDTTVRLWDTATSTSRELRGHNGYVTAIAFSPDGKILATEIGNIRVDKLLDSSFQNLYQKPYYTGYSISSDQKWIMRDSAKLMWLPEEYRPVSAVAHTAMTMAFGCRTGQVLILEFLP